MSSYFNGNRSKLQKTNDMDAKLKFSSGNLLSILISVVFASFFVFVFKIYNEESVSKGVFADEKENIINELKRTKRSLEISTAENTLFQSELLVQKQKVANLVDEINLSNVDIGSMNELNNKVNKLHFIVERLAAENHVLKTEKTVLKRQRDSLLLVVSKRGKQIDTLVVRNNNEGYLFQDKEKISIVNLRTTAVNQDNKGRFESTDYAKSANRLKVSFSVVGSKINEPCKKEFYVQIIDSKNNVVGEKRTKNFGNLELNYSFLSAVMFHDKTVEVSTDVALKSAEKGTYIVSIFDKGELASNTSFRLR